MIWKSWWLGGKYPNIPIKLTSLRWWCHYIFYRRVDYRIASRSIRFRTQVSASLVVWIIHIIKGAEALEWRFSDFFRACGLQCIFRLLPLTFGGFSTFVWVINLCRIRPWKDLFTLPFYDCISIEDLDQLSHFGDSSVKRWKSWYSLLINVDSSKIPKKKSRGYISESRKKKKREGEVSTFGWFLWHSCLN